MLALNCYYTTVTICTIITVNHDAVTLPLPVLYLFLVVGGVFYCDYFLLSSYACCTAIWWWVKLLLVGFLCLYRHWEIGPISLTCLGWKQKAHMCYYIKKQLEHFHNHLSMYNVLYTLCGLSRGLRIWCQYKTSV